MPKKKPHLLEPLVRRDTRARQSGPGMEQPPVRRATAVLTELKKYLTREISEARGRKDIYSLGRLERQWTFTNGQEDALGGVWQFIKRTEEEGLRATNVKDHSPIGAVSASNPESNSAAPIG